MNKNDLMRRVPAGLVPLTQRTWATVGPFLLEFVGHFARVNPRPVIILGNQKSGTSAVAGLLAMMTGKSVSVDLLREGVDPTWDRLRRGETTFAKIVRRNTLDFSRDIVKEVNLAPFYDEMTAYFPDSPVIFVVRDPRDNIRSFLNRLGLPGNQEQIPLFEGPSARIRRLILDGRWLGIDGANYIEMLAGRWRLYAEVCLEHRDRLVVCRYEDFLADKEGEIARVAEAVGLPRVKGIGAKKDYEFQPPGNRAVRWLDFFGERNLERIERICAEPMRALGYAPREEAARVAQAP